MSRSVIYIGIAILFFPGLMKAQQVKNKIGNEVTYYELVQQGDSLYFNMSMNLGEINVDDYKSMDIIPVVTDGIRLKELPMISIHGKRKHKEYRRLLALMGRKEKTAYTAPYIIKKYGKEKGGLEYKYVMPFESWMKTAWGEIRADLCGCGMVTRMFVSRSPLFLEKETVVKPSEFKPVLAFVQPEMESGVKQRVMQDEAFLDFVVGMINIHPEFGNNPRELAKIRSMVEDIRDDKGVTIRNIDIIGYASPEGSLSLNKRLSEGRAKALQNYLKERYDIPQNTYTVHFGGEDWEGLVRLIEKSDMAEKQQVLDVIEKYSIENGRERKIMDLADGKPYHYMLKMMFPSLRRVICKVNYDVKAFNVEEAKEVIRTHPQNLSLSEMYAVANAYEEGSLEFCDVFEVAVKLFSEDETTKLNAAVAALSRKDVTLAERYLDNIKSKVHVQQYDNAMGVLYALKGDYVKAVEYFETAAVAGLPAAESNLEQIRNNKFIETKK
jgi:hypothetical protein